jgi:cysteine desulfuration protein SufE
MRHAQLWLGLRMVLRSLGAMSLAEKEARLIARYTVIEDRHERLAAVTARGRKWPGLLETERTDDCLVPGCTSRVWLVGELRDGRCHFRMEADSTLVKGLAALICELNEGETPADIVASQPKLMEAIGFDRMISPTRLHGFAQIQSAIHDFARKHA